jgi:hypothetical protein
MDAPTPFFQTALGFVSPTAHRSLRCDFRHAMRRSTKYAYSICLFLRLRLHSLTEVVRQRLPKFLAEG